MITKKINKIKSSNAKERGKKKPRIIKPVRGVKQFLDGMGRAGGIYDWA